MKKYIQPEINVMEMELESQLCQSSIEISGTQSDGPAPDFDYASPILDFSIFRGQNRHFCPRLVSFEHQTKA